MYRINQIHDRFVCACRLLDKTYKKGSGIRKQDAGTAFGAIARNPIGMDLAWNYLREHWTRITE